MEVMSSGTSKKSIQKPRQAGADKTVSIPIFLCSVLFRQTGDGEKRHAVGGGLRLCQSHR
jgi:hypothetical protein